METSKKVIIKSFLWAIVVLLLFSALLHGNTNFKAYSTNGEAKVFIDPPKTELYGKAVGDTFAVNVTVANITGLCGLEFKLYWNSSLLNCTSMQENLYKTVTPSGEEDNIWKLKHIVDNTAGMAWYAYLYMDLPRAITAGYAPINITTETFPPEGKLAAAILTFKIIEAPTEGNVSCALHLDEVKPGDQNGEPIPVTVEDGLYIIPEFPEYALVLLLMAVSTIAVTFRLNGRRKFSH
jgi:hypothetical protein